MSKRKKKTPQCQKIYCFVPSTSPADIWIWKRKSLRCDHFRNLFCRWPLFRFTATQDRPNPWENTFFGWGMASQILFVGNTIFPRRPNLWRIIFLVAEILCLWINPNITFYEEELLLLKYWNTISPDKRSFTQLLVTLCNHFEYKTIKETKKHKEWMWKERKYLEDERWNTTSDR